MKFLNRLERIFGRWAIPDVTIGLVSLQAFTYIVSLVRPEFVDRLVLRREAVLHGEVWRLVTFLVMPPAANPIFAFFGLYLLYLMGTALERQWGEFRYNVYLLIGYVGSVAVTMLIPGTTATNVYFDGSILLAFAWLYPDFEILLFLFFPVKVKWIALLVWIGYLVSFLGGEWPTRALVAASTLNFLLFFGDELLAAAKYRLRRARVKAKYAPPDPADAFHRCVVCGITEKQNPRMEFRYCPQCAGTPAYCMEHFPDHVHR